MNAKLQAIVDAFIQEFVDALLSLPLAEFDAETRRVKKASAPRRRRAKERRTHKPSKKAPKPKLQLSTNVAALDDLQKAAIATLYRDNNGLWVLLTGSGRRWTATRKRDLVYKAKKKNISFEEMLPHSVLKSELKAPQEQSTQPGVLPNGIRI